MKVRNEFSLRVAVAYLIALAVAPVLAPAVWGAAGGVALGLAICGSTEIQQQCISFFNERGIDPQTDQAKAMAVLQGLSDEDRMKLVKPIFSKINWFNVMLIGSALVFGITTFLGGFFARNWVLAGLFPAVSLLHGHNLVAYSPMASNPTAQQKAIVIVFAQFAVSYLFAYWGARLGWKRYDKKEELANLAVAEMQH